MPEVIKAAGILIQCQDKVLLLKRSYDSSQPGTWGIVGGKIGEGETPLAAARRECQEEIGISPPENLEILSRRIKADPENIDTNFGPTVDYTCFLWEVDEEFIPTLNSEHLAHHWAPIDNPLHPLHPGVGSTIKMLSGNELDIARLMSEGEAISPQKVGNFYLYNIRITGTGVAYRLAHEEFCWRDPSIYLNTEFLARCNGLPVIFEHPNNGQPIGGEEFNNRIVGTVFLPYIRDSEVWAIAKIYDESTIEILQNVQMSTSPSVIFSPNTNILTKTNENEPLLIEGQPAILDHIAICSAGVWDKAKDPTGIIQQGISQMPELENPPKETEMKSDTEDKRDDADAGQKLDKMLSCLDAITSRLDALESRKDSEKKDDAAKAEQPVKEDAAPEVKADMGDEKPFLSKNDAQVMADKIAELERNMPKDIKDDDYVELAHTQQKADAVFMAFGSNCPRPLQGETPLSYRKRIASQLQKHSKQWKAIDLIRADTAVLDIAESQIYSDAMDVALHPMDLPSGELRSITRVDPLTGQRSTTFHGNTTFFSQMKSPSRFVQAADTSSKKGS